MTTSIVFTREGKTLIPSVFSVPVAGGDSFELSVAGDAKAVLYFSPALAAILSPAPGTSITLSAGGAVAFTFQSSDLGAYSIVTGGESDPAPTHFRTVPSSHVTLESTFHPESVAFPVDGGRSASNN